MNKLSFEKFLLNFVNVSTSQCTVEVKKMLSILLSPVKSEMTTYKISINIRDPGWPPYEKHVDHKMSYMVFMKSVQP